MRLKVELRSGKQFEFEVEGDIKRIYRVLETKKFIRLGSVPINTNEIAYVQELR